MSITLNQFSAGVLTAAQLNALVDAITAKFNNGVGTNDLASPLKLPGNLDMQQFDILNLYTLWGAYNLAERASGTTLQDVLDAVNTAGGGVVLLPANTTESIGTAGDTIGSNTMIVGEGDTSILSASGTLSGHSLRNKASGNSNITLMNIKITTSGTGAFDLISMTRTTDVRFVDCWIVAANQNGVSLLTNSAGSACINTWFDRCRVDISGTGTVGVYMTDVQGLRMRDCEFTSSVNSSYDVRFAAFGAGSLCDDIDINDNHFTHTGTTQVGISVSSTASPGIVGLSIHDNGFKSARGSMSLVIDVNGYTSASGTNIDDNEINVANLVTAAIRVQTLTRFSVCGNEITAVSSATGQGTGILIGADQRGGTAAAARNYNCSNNEVAADGSCFVFCHPGSSSMRCVVSSNHATSQDSPEYEIWNLGANPTTLLFDM